MADLMGMRRIPVCRRSLVDEEDFPGGGTSLADMVLGFFEEGSPESCSSEGDNDEADEEGDKNSGRMAERKAFWELQQKLLKESLFRTSSLEAKIRQDTERALRDSRSTGPLCICPKRVARVCRNCLLGEVSDRLRNAGYNSAICKSEWRSSPGIPAGEHTYLDVMDTTNAKKGTVRVVIEVDFRGEFEMAITSPEYKKLIERLPQVFVGKEERLKTVIKILCGAVKTCMKENKMHMGPWRKHKYVQAKWLGTCNRTERKRDFSPNFSDQQTKPKASLLTFELLEKLPSLHCTAEAVV